MVTPCIRRKQREGCYHGDVLKTRNSAESRVDGLAADVLLCYISTVNVNVPPADFRPVQSDRCPVQHPSKTVGRGGELKCD